MKTRRCAHCHGPEAVPANRADNRRRVLEWLHQVAGKLELKTK
jgi:hypothetical protein